MKQFLFVIIFVFIYINGHSQNVSITMSMLWKQGFDVFKSDSVTDEPFLTITYSNHADTYFYLLKITNSPSEYPLMLIGHLIHSISQLDSVNYRKIARLSQNCCLGKYYVLVGGGGYVNSAWVAQPNSVYFSNDNEVVIDNINSSIEDIHSYLCLRKYEDPDCNDSEIFFRKELLTPKRIRENKKNQFVFLNPGESHTDEFSLVAFKEVGGTFEFLLSPTYQPDSVYVEPVWDNKSKMIVERKEKLPMKIEKYELYEDEILKDTLFIDFNPMRR